MKISPKIVIYNESNTNTITNDIYPWCHKVILFRVFLWRTLTKNKLADDTYQYTTTETGNRSDKNYN